MTYSRIDGTDLYSEERGTGEPVLLLHGGFCSLESLRSLFEDLAGEHRVHAFERPGHGRSADAEGEYGYAQGVAQTLAYLDARALGAVHVVGYSDGAIIGLLLALYHPDRVHSLVAVSANLDPSGFAHAPGASGLPVLTALRAPGEQKPDVERAHYERLSPDGPEHAEVVLAKLFRLWTEEPRIDAGDLARIAAPTLIMSADRDTIRPDHSLLIASSIPDAQLCIVPGTTHHLVHERPALISAVVREFLWEALRDGR